MLYGGVISDRFPRRTVLIVSQTAMMSLAFVLAGLAFAGAVRPWHILVLACGLGLANAFDAPARQSFVVELVEREDLTNAIALNATMFNMATAVGPAVAGVTYQLFGPAWCFALNGVSFIAVIAALSSMRFPARAASPPRRSARAELKEALRYVAGHSVIRSLIVLVGLMGWFGIALMTLIPAWAVTVLGGNAATNGLLQSGRGVGALAAALGIASLGRFRFKGKVLAVGMVTFPVFLVAFAFARSLPLSLVLIAGVGASVILVLNLANALVQTHVPDRMRGRVMAVYTLVFFGFMPVGSLWIGGLAQRVGPPNAIIASAAVCAVVAVFVWSSSQIRSLE
jgi:MFS family permease